MAFRDNHNKLPEFVIYYDYHETPFGKALIGFTKDKNNDKVVCHLSFPVDLNESKTKEDTQGLDTMKQKFSTAKFIKEQNETKKLIEEIFYEKEPLLKSKEVRVLLKGTDFQTKVWEAISHILMSQGKRWRNLRVKT